MSEVGIDFLAKKSCVNSKPGYFLQGIIYQFVITQVNVPSAIYWNEYNYLSDNKSNKLFLLLDSDYFRVGAISGTGGRIC